MRDVNVTKYRKLLYNLQYFCSHSKRLMTFQHCKTDYERGFVVGKHAAYNDVLREIAKMVRDANYDWDSMCCREEKKDV